MRRNVTQVYTAYVLHSQVSIMQDTITS